MIARLDLTPSGYFAVQATQVGSTDEEIVAIGEHKIAEERIRAIAGRLQFAFSTMLTLPPQGNC